MTSFRTAVLLIIAANIMTVSAAGAEKSIVRINCGSKTDLTDSKGNIWLADTGDTVRSKYHAIGGRTWKRDQDLPILGSDPDLYRTERFRLDGYTFAVDKGTYAMRLYFAEACEAIFDIGPRDFDISVNGKTALKSLDPYKEAGGFGRPVVYQIDGINAPSGKIELGFKSANNTQFIQGIELFQNTKKDWAVTKLTKPDTCIVIPDTSTAAAPKGIKSVLFVGNSRSYGWAIPVSVERLVNDNTRSKIKCYQCMKPRSGLSEHGADTLKKAVERMKYDAIVLQGIYDKRDRDVAGAVAAKVKTLGTKVYLYCDWASQKTPADTVEQDFSTIDSLGKALGSTVIEIGRAWGEVRKSRPDIMIDNADSVHAAMYGAYLISHMIFSKLSGESPKDLKKPSMDAGNIVIVNEKTKYLDNIAWSWMNK
jgi:hypothetical protein